jgi:hypothetical protein
MQKRIIAEVAKRPDSFRAFRTKEDPTHGATNMVGLAEGPPAGLMVNYTMAPWP